MAKPEEILAARQARQAYGDALCRYPNVIGIAAGLRQHDGEYTEEVAVQVFVSRKYPPGHLPYGAMVPPSVPGPDGEPIRIDVIDVGFVRPLDDAARYRPVVGGCSIGTAAAAKSGTLGGWAWDDTDQAIVLLTCNHVLTANDMTRIPSDASVLQPGEDDGGSEPNDVIGHTKRIVPIQVLPTGTSGLIPATAVDCGVATMTAPFSDQIIGIGGGIFETAPPTLGMNVQKRGKDTERTTNGMVTSLDASISLTYPAGIATIGIGSSVFFITSTDNNAFCGDGDSGSVIFSRRRGVLHGTYPAVGLLFGAGAADPFHPVVGTMVFACAIGSVFGALQLTTVCSGLINDLIQSVGRSSRAGVHMSVETKANQLRQLRDQVLSQTSAGLALSEFVTGNAPALARLMLTDETAHGLAVNALAPWIVKSSNFELLQGIIEADTVARVGLLVDYLAGAIPEQASTLRQLHALLARDEGKTVAELLRHLAG
jgi:hypothetical protein